MKRIFFAVIIGLSLMGSLEMVRAQTDEKPAPTAPYLAPVPDYGHWMVTFNYKPDAPQGATGSPGVAAAKPPAAPDGSPTAIETIKTGDLRGVTLTFADGTSKQFTCQGDWILSSTPKGPQLSIAIPTAIPYIYYTTGFIFLDGVTVNMSTFKETALHNGAFAFHYQSGGTDVWIDPNTMLPLDAKQSGVKASYQFLTPPPRPFPIPKDQAALLQKEENAYKATNSMR